jgi:N-acetylmuramoyl-L-alanine amidase
MKLGARVCVDPGHGGNDPGATAGHVRESDLNLIFGRELGAKLINAGAKVAMTRTTDVLPGGRGKDAALMERCRIANTFRAVCFVSVHFNYSDDPHASGFQVFHAKGSLRGAALAHSVNRAVTGGEPHGHVYPDDSPQDGNRRLAVLRHTAMPAILIEFGFVSNVEDVRKARDSQERAAVLNAVVAGIDAWLKAQPLAG